MLSNYVAQIALHGDISINQKAIPKINTCITAETHQEDQLVMFFLQLILTLLKWLMMTVIC
jgi:hypothetical protein